MLAFGAVGDGVVVGGGAATGYKIREDAGEAPLGGWERGGKFAS